MKLLSLPIILLALAPGAEAMAAGSFGGNTSITFQRGNNNAASTILKGDRNLTTIVQLGNGHEYNYSYTGDDRGLTVVQTTTMNMTTGFTLSSGNSMVGSTIVIGAQAAP